MRTWVPDMVWECDMERGIGSSKSGYENVQGRKMKWRKTTGKIETIKNDMRAVCIENVNDRDN